MLKIFICPKCYNFRMVSRNPAAVCLHCGTHLDHSELQYAEFMDMSEEQRELFKEKYKKRLMLYREKLDALLIEQPVVK